VMMMGIMTITTTESLNHRATTSGLIRSKTITGSTAGEQLRVRNYGGYQGHLEKASNWGQQSAEPWYVSGGPCPSMSSSTS
jgi:hypothetical protein